MARTGIMLCHPLEERRLERWNTRHVLVQPKLDGERCRVVYYSNEPVPFLYTSEMNEFKSVPHILEALTKVHPGYSCEFDGELYTHGWDFSQIHSVVSRTENLHTDHEMIQLHLFDTINNYPQLSRIARFREFCADCDTTIIKPVTTILVENDSQTLMDCLEGYTDEGYEGIIIRHPGGVYERKRSNWIMKFKPRKSDTYEIVDVVEEISKDGIPKNSLGALILRDDQGTTFGCGSGFTREQREEYWKVRDLLPGMYCEIKYQQLSPKRVPRFPIFSKIVTLVNDLP